MALRQLAQAAGLLRGSAGLLRPFATAPSVYDKLVQVRGAAPVSWCLRLCQRCADKVYDNKANARFCPLPLLALALSMVAWVLFSRFRRVRSPDPRPVCSLRLWTARGGGMWCVAPWVRAWLTCWRDTWTRWERRVSARLRSQESDGLMRTHGRCTAAGSTCRCAHCAALFCGQVTEACNHAPPFWAPHPLPGTRHLSVP